MQFLQTNFLLALLEDCGYMARVSVVLDPIFKRVGLSGKSVIPLVTVGSITIYRSKSDVTKYYCSEHRAGNIPIFKDNDIDMVRFHNNYSWVKDAYIGNNIVFENHFAEIYLKKYLGI